ncbi:hypothetical protein TcWFU_002101 [Taenia crassiceps]|uniref:Uncharacterized protein n=1 Tax=Taenia crassiceps TaxID=6207 RepID=A0ABR4Q1U9_9CEST
MTLELPVTSGHVIMTTTAISALSSLLSSDVTFDRRFCRRLTLCATRLDIRDASCQIACSCSSSQTDNDADVIVDLGYHLVLAQYIDQFSWVDKHLCKLLFPRPSPDSARYAAEAILYQREQTMTSFRTLSIHSCVQLGCQLRLVLTVNFRIMPDFDEDTMMGAG